MTGENSFTESEKESLHQIPTSTLNRILSDPELRSFLGFELDKGELKYFLEVEEIVKGLRRVTSDLLDKDNFNVDNVRSKDARKAYRSKFASDAPDNTRVIGVSKALVEVYTCNHKSKE